MKELDILMMWSASLLSGLALTGARLGWLLFRVAPDPPEEPMALALWRRKRRWLVISELSALPGFATVAVTVGRMQEWPVEGVVLFSMCMGALGFAFLLDALETLVRKRLDTGDRK
jgi:hypothetical protein